MKTIFNIVLYSINPLEEVFEEVNVFSKKESKRIAQEKQLTKKPVIGLGFKDIEFLKVVTKSTKEVDAYWRDQPFGPGRLLRRPQLISGYVATRVKTYDSDGTTKAFESCDVVE